MTPALAALQNTGGAVHRASPKSKLHSDIVDRRALGTDIRCAMEQWGLTCLADKWARQLPIRRPATKETAGDEEMVPLVSPPFLSFVRGFKRY